MTQCSIDPNALISIEDIYPFFRQQPTPDEQQWLTVQLSVAYSLMKEAVPNFEARLASGDLNRLIVTERLFNIVARVFYNQNPGVVQSSRSTGPFSESTTYSTKGSDRITLLPEDLAGLIPTAVAGRAFGTIRTGVFPWQVP